MHCIHWNRIDRCKLVCNAPCFHKSVIWRYLLPQNRNYNKYKWNKKNYLFHLQNINFTLKVYFQSLIIRQFWDGCKDTKIYWRSRTHVRYKIKNEINLSNFRQSKRNQHKNFAVITQQNERVQQYQLRYI